MNTESTENTEEDLEAGATETNDADQDQEPTNPLSLSDEEVMAMDDPTASVGESAESDDDPDGSEDVPGADATETDDDSAAGEPEQKGAEQDSEKDSEGEAPERDIAAEHASIFAPIKSRGKTLEVKNLDEVRSLMEKGADYHRKTEELAGHRKTIKTLEKAGIKPEDMNYLIELHNKEPQAIAKLIADSKIDPFELDPDSEETKNYKPKEHSVSDADMHLNEVMDELRTTPTWTQLLDVVGNKWDDTSRQAVATDTNLLRTMNEHIDAGIHEVVDTELQRQRTLGNLQGLNDLSAYQQVAHAMGERGELEHLITPELEARWAQRAGLTPPAPKVAVRPRQGSSDPNLDAKRRAATPARAAARTGAQTSNQKNPLALSDADFEKQFSSSL